MSKYNLSDILNEYIGGGRIGTLKISFKDLQDKMDDLENSGKVIVRTLPGPSGDGKVNREFEVVDRDSAVPGGNKQERGFTVYDYKFGFDPGDEEHFMEEYPFSVGGNDLKLAMELIDGVEPYGLEENRREKNPEGMGQLYVQPAVQREVKFHLDAYDKGNIDVDDMIQAIEDIIFGYVKAPGMREQIDVDVDLVKATAAKANNQITNAAGMADFILDVIRQIGEKEQEAILNNINIKQAIGFLEKAKDQVKESTGPSDKAETEDDVVNIDKVAGPGAKGRNYGAETSANTAEDDMEDKEVANPRPMFEAPGSTINISQADMDKLHNDGKVDIDGHKVVFKMNENGDVENFANELNEESSKKAKIRAYLKDYYTNPKDPKDVRIDDGLIDEFFEYSEDIPNFENMDMDEIVDEYDEFIFQNKDVMEDVRKHFKRFM